MQKMVVGWDIGGAHIKAAVVDSTQSIVQVFQYACPLWKGMEYLDRTVKQVLTDITVVNRCHIITMTGELTDLFDNRDEGVEQIISAMQKHLAADEIFIYAGLDGFLKPGLIQQQHYISIASANWLASASFAASRVEQGLFIDIGSTTTDILILANAKVESIGMTDYERMLSEELVYTGIIRTAVMAVVQSAYFQGHKIALMAEYFATMADIYRLTGELNEAHDQTETADGKEKNPLASAKRLSRMTGIDYLEQDLALWQQLAKNIKSQQKNKIKAACERQLSRMIITDNSAFIGAGVGRFLVKQIADELGYPYCDYNDLMTDNRNNASLSSADCAPAVAVAALFLSLSVV